MAICSKTRTLEIDGDIWCRRCAGEWLHSDEELASRPCHACGLVHIADRTTLKVDGYYCDPCAKAYERKLLEALTA